MNVPLSANDWSSSEIAAFHFGSMFASLKLVGVEMVFNLKFFKLYGTDLILLLVLVGVVFVGVCFCFVGVGFVGFAFVGVGLAGGVSSNSSSSESGEAVR